MLNRSSIFALAAVATVAVAALAPTSASARHGGLSVAGTSPAAGNGIVHGPGLGRLDLHTNALPKVCTRWARVGGSTAAAHLITYYC
jgi:hypothetical protein